MTSNFNSKIEYETLEDRIEAHELWLASDGKCGERFVCHDGEDLSGAIFYGKDLRDADFSNGNVSGAAFASADVSRANFRDADVSDANFDGTIFTGANFTDAIGIASKDEEMAEAARILKIIESGQGELEMGDWHTCETSHCLAGWACPDIEFPAAAASVKIPTLARYFYEPDEEIALDALKRVAAGDESVWN